jgi:protein-arginine kinase activator protein McsA
VAQSPADVLENLKQQLQLAIAAEDFERAATIRDQIRTKEQKD